MSCKSPPLSVSLPSLTEHPLLSRGVKAEFKNPLHDPSHADGIFRDPDDPSHLPVEDREYSPSPYCPPKLLFPDARKHDHARLRKKSKASSGSASGSSPEPEKKKQKMRVAGPSTPKPKGNRASRSQPSSEWDTLDEEDTPRPARNGKREAGGVQPRFPVDVVPAHQQEEASEDEKEVEAQIQQMPSKDLKRIAKLAPFLVAGER